MTSETTDPAVPEEQNPVGGDHYYLIAPMALVHPSRWNEINPFDAKLTRDEQYNATARITVVASVTGTLYFQHWLPMLVGGVALGALHYHWVVTTPQPESAPPVFSHNPLPFASNVQAPPAEDRTLDSLFGVKNRPEEIRIRDTSTRNFKDMATTIDGKLSAAPQRFSRQFETQMGRKQFPAVQGAH